MLRRCVPLFLIVLSLPFTLCAETLYGYGYVATIYHTSPESGRYSDSAHGMLYLGITYRKPDDIRRMTCDDQSYFYVSSGDLGYDAILTTVQRALASGEPVEVAFEWGYSNVNIPRSYCIGSDGRYGYYIAGKVRYIRFSQGNPARLAECADMDQSEQNDCYMNFDKSTCDVLGPTDEYECRRWYYDNAPYTLSDCIGKSGQEKNFCLRYFTVADCVNIRYLGTKLACYRSFSDQ